MKFINNVEVKEDGDTIAAQVLITETDGHSSVTFVNNTEYEKLKETIENLDNTALKATNAIDIINFETTAEKGINAMKLNNKSEDEFATARHGHNDLAKQISLINHADTLSTDNQLGHSKVISNPSPNAVYNNADAAGANSVVKLFKETEINRNLMKNILFDEKGVTVGTDKSVPYNAKSIPLKFWIYDKNGNPVPAGQKASMVVWEVSSGKQSYAASHTTSSGGLVQCDLKGKLKVGLHICICDWEGVLGSSMLFAFSP